MLLRRIVECPPHPPIRRHVGRRLAEQAFQNQVALFLPPELLIPQESVGLRRRQALELQRHRGLPVNVPLPGRPTNKEIRFRRVYFQPATS